jgi:hypothetical protein
VQLAERKSGQRIAPGRGKGARRAEHKSPLAKFDVRNGQPGRRPCPAAPQHDVKVQHPSGPALAAVAATEGRLDGLELIEQLHRIQPGLDQRCAIGIAPPRGPERSGTNDRHGFEHFEPAPPSRAGRGGGAADSSPARSDSAASRSDVLADPAVKLRPAIAEEAHAGAVRAARPDRGGDQHAAFRRAEFGDQIAPFVGDEAVAIEVLPVLAADAVGGDHRHAVRHRMALHRPPPHPAGIEIGVIGFGADGGGIEQQFGAHQRHHPRAFGIPLVPADADADACAEHVPHLEAVVAGAEIVLFLIARPVGNVALAVGAHDSPSAPIMARVL